MAPDQQTYFHTMSNPNANAITYMLYRALQGTNFTAAEFKIVHIDTDKIPVIICEMAPLNGVS